MSDLFSPTTMESVQRAASDAVPRLLRWSGSCWRGYLITMKHHWYTLSLHPYTSPARQVLFHHCLIEGGIKAWVQNHFPQFVQLINGRAWIPIPKVRSIIFYLPKGWFSRPWSFQIYMMENGENTCFLLFQTLMSYLEPRSHNKGSACVVILSKRKFYYRYTENWYAKETCKGDTQIQRE